MGSYNIKDKTALFVSGHYGTASVLDVPFSNGSLTFRNGRIMYGDTLLGGVELTLGSLNRDWFHVTAGVGGTYVRPA